MENREVPILHELPALRPGNAPDGAEKLFVCPEEFSGQTKNLFLCDLCASVVKVNISKEISPWNVTKQRT
jgi:hypothetical protein